MPSDQHFRTTPNGRAITLVPAAEGVPTFKATPGGFAGLVVSSGFSVRIEGAPYVEFTAGDIVWLTDAADGVIYIVAEAAIGGRDSRLLSLPEVRIDELYGVIVGRYLQLNGRIVPESLEDLNDFAPVGDQPPSGSIVSAEIFTPVAIVAVPAQAFFEVAAEWMTFDPSAVDLADDLDQHGHLRPHHVAGPERVIDLRRLSDEIEGSTDAHLG